MLFGLHASIRLTARRSRSTKLSYCLSTATTTTTTTANNMNSEINSRFRTQILTLDHRKDASNSSVSSSSSVASVENLERFASDIEAHPACQNIIGMVVLSSFLQRNAINVILPLFEGKVQRHLITTTKMKMKLKPTKTTTTSTVQDGKDDDDDDVNDNNNRTDSDEIIVLCALNPRANTSDALPCTERPVDEERARAVQEHLQSLDINYEDFLLGGPYAGTPPARIYHSFANPRSSRNNNTLAGQALRVAAQRSALQISLALRQTRADQAAYLRNADKIDASRIASLTDGADSDNDITQSTISDAAKKTLSHNHKFVLLLDNIRSAFNVGSLFRTGETAGIVELVTAGITAHPPHAKLTKTAMQSISLVSTRHFPSIVDAVIALRLEGYRIVVMETTNKSKRYTEVKYPTKTVLICGNEITGVDTRVMEMADEIVEIPTFGAKNSLNVAAAVPIVLFHMIHSCKAN